MFEYINNNANIHKTTNSLIVACDFVLILNFVSAVFCIYSSSCLFLSILEDHYKSSIASVNVIKILLFLLISSYWFPPSYHGEKHG